MIRPLIGEESNWNRSETKQYNTIPWQYNTTYSISIQFTSSNKTTTTATINETIPYQTEIKQSRAIWTTFVEAHENRLKSNPNKWIDWLIIPLLYASRNHITWHHFTEQHSTLVQHRTEHLHSHSHLFILHCVDQYMLIPRILINGFWFCFTTVCYHHRNSYTLSVMSQDNRKSADW